MILVVSFGIPLNFTSRAMLHLPHLDPTQPVALESEWGRSDQLTGVQHPFQHCDTILFSPLRHFGGRVTSLRGHILALCRRCSVPAWHSGWFQGYFQNFSSETLSPRSDEGLLEFRRVVFCHSAWMFGSWNRKEICFQLNSHMTKDLCHEAFLGADASLALSTVALLAELVWFRALAALAWCRGMAARFSPALLAEWLSGNLNRSEAWPDVFHMGISCASLNPFF